MSDKKRIAVLTSGGDAPGMNAAIRAVVRAAVTGGLEVLGIRDGFAGLVEGSAVTLGPRDVSGIIGRGGTMLGSSRFAEFCDSNAQQQALACLQDLGVEGLVVIGGNGSQTGAQALAALGVPVVGIASTIDNDLVGSDVTLGVDSAVGVALEAMDRLKTTAASHHRVFLVETMGRRCGYLALVTAITGGAEVVVLPEEPTTPEAVLLALDRALALGKRHGIVVIAEGAHPKAEVLAAALRVRFEVRSTVLGHVQRGAAPSPFDRLLGSRLGAAAVNQLIAGEHGVLVGLVAGAIHTTPLAEVAGRVKALPPDLRALARQLAG